MTPPNVVVVGGGLAGLSAALELVDGGASVTLLERRPRLGGATWSFQRRGLWFDNGQHVFLRCCTSYLAFLERIGATSRVHLQHRLDVPVMAPGARTARLRRGHLPAPLHLGASLARYHHLSLADRLRLGRAALALRGIDLADPALDSTTFADFLAQRGQSLAAIERLWDLICTPTVNVRAHDASLLLAATVFQVGLLTDAAAGDIGWSRVPLSQLHAEPARAALERSGAEVRTSAAVEAIQVDGDRMRLVAGGEPLAADAVIVAVPHDAAAGLLDGLVDGAGEWPKLGASPIVNVHLVYDRQVMGEALVAGVGTPLQFVFDRTASAGLQRGQCLAVSLSAADEWLGLPPDALIAMAERELARLFPAAAQAERVDAVVTREHAATFRGGPGTQAFRPGTATNLPNLYLAGAWTDTGWPATMEGAVRSGHAAARRARAPRTDATISGGAGVIDTAPEVLTRAKTLVEPALATALTRLHPDVRRATEHHLGWATSEGSPTGGGKGIRPALAVLSAEAVGAEPEVAVPGAVAVELVHNFSLLHDDIIDGDQERRHRPTVWALFGIGAGLLVGDALHTLAFQVLLENPAAAATPIGQRLATSVAAMIDGQSSDMAFESQERVSVDDCRTMAEAKTGALLAFAASSGAVLAGADDSTVDALDAYGLHLGLAFQAADDLLGIWGSPAVTGKPVGSDLTSKKKTLPVALAMAADATAADELSGLFRNGPLDEAAVARATALIEAAGGRDATAELAQEQLAAALAALQAAALDPTAAGELAALAHYVCDRQR